MHAFTPKFKQIGSLILNLLALASLLCTALWPPSIAHLLHSRLAVGLAGIWCAATSLLLYPELLAGLLLGIHEFRKACREMFDDIDDSL
jgi:hypothetical protein